ncbi:glycosyltransferase family A protein [Pyrobaculum sp.]|uniref:glycosyltransferase family 2 protein n=1 Tax=Pyrobaculum sp. TaxID=2004705 RepID=UPI00316A745D
MKYIIITLVKNEFSNLLRTAKYVTEQSLKPELWVIVDDNSTDQTPDLIRKLRKNYDFIVAIQLPTNEKSYNSVTKYGYAIRYATNYVMLNYYDVYNKINYVGVLDADLYIPSNYYDKVIKLHESNKHIGIASGLFFEVLKPFTKRRGKIIKLRLYPWPISAAMIIKKECLEEIGGFPTVPQPDVAAMIKAIEKGWKIGVTTSTYAIHLRPRNLKTLINAGYGNYLLHLPLIKGLLQGLYNAIKFRYPQQVGLTIGYLIGLASRENKINDQIIHKYLRNINTSRIIKNSIIYSALNRKYINYKILEKFTKNIYYVIDQKI